MNREVKSSMMLKHAMKLLIWCFFFFLPENLADLEVLNLARNKLKSLPQTIVKLVKLRKLVISSNEINFDGIPLGISKLVCLEQFIASGNKLESVPEGLFR